MPRSTASTSPTARSSSTTTRRSTTPLPHCTSHELYKGILAGQARGGVQRPHPRPAGRAEDRRQADQPGAAAVGRRAGQLQPAARDLRRRREVHARRRRRPARRRRALLPAGARPHAATQARDLLLHAFAGEVLGEISVDRAARRASKRPLFSPARPRPGIRGGSRMTTAVPAAAAAAVDVEAPARRVPDPARSAAHGQPLVYLDNAATTQKPRAVIDAIAALLRDRQRQRPPRRAPAVGARHGGLRRRARRRRRASSAPPHAHEIIFTRNATEGINLVAQQLGRANLAAGDEVLISAMEHHSNIVPWQMACERTGAHAARSSRSTTAASSTSTPSRRLLGRAHEDGRGDATCRTRSAP